MTRNSGTARKFRWVKRIHLTGQENIFDTETLQVDRKVPDAYFLGQHNCLRAEKSQDPRIFD